MDKNVEKLVELVREILTNVDIFHSIPKRNELREAVDHLSEAYPDTLNRLRKDFKTVVAFPQSDCAQRDAIVSFARYWLENLEAEAQYE